MDESNLKLQIALLFVFMFLLVIAVAVRLYFYNANESARSQILSSLNTTEGLILMHPYIKDGLQTFEVNEIIVKTGIYPKYKMGDYVEISNLKVTQYGFSYHPKITKDDKKSNKLLLFISENRSKLIESVQSSLPEPYAGLLLGTIIGYKEDLPQNLIEKLQRTSTIHIIVVSGYNVSLVLGFLAIILYKLKGAQFLIAILVFLVIFILLIGPDPPVIRASVMGLIATYAYIRGNSTNSLYLLFLSICFMLIISPGYLSDVGFQLSALATFSVILAMYFVHYLPKMTSQLVVTIMVSLMISPIIGYYFGVISIVGILINILVLWVIPLITLLGIGFMLMPILPLKIGIVALMDYFFSILDIGISLGGVWDYKPQPIHLVIYYFCLVLLLRYLINGLKHEVN